jgi:hypothetical protein
MITAKLFPILRTGPTISISSTYYVTVLRVYEIRSVPGRCSDLAFGVRPPPSIERQGKDSNLAPSGAICKRVRAPVDFRADSYDASSPGDGQPREIDIADNCLQIV